MSSGGGPPAINQGLSETAQSAHSAAAESFSDAEPKSNSCGGAPKRNVDPNTIKITDPPPDAVALQETAQLRQAPIGSPESQALASDIAKRSTRMDCPADRVVLGPYKQQGGYIGEAKANCGTYFQTCEGFYDAAGRDPNISWQVNEAFLDQQLQSGVSALEFHGTDVEDTLANFADDPHPPARYKEIRYLEQNAGKYGYERHGNSYVKVR